MCKVRFLSQLGSGKHADKKATKIKSRRKVGKVSKTKLSRKNSEITNSKKRLLSTLLESLNEIKYMQMKNMKLGNINPSLENKIKGQPKMTLPAMEETNPVVYSVSAEEKRIKIPKIKKQSRNTYALRKSPKYPSNGKKKKT